MKKCTCKLHENKSTDRMTTWGMGWRRSSSEQENLNLGWWTHGCLHSLLLPPSNIILLHLVLIQFRRIKGSKNSLHFLFTYNSIHFHFFSSPVAYSSCRFLFSDSVGNSLVLVDRNLFYPLIREETKRRWSKVEWLVLWMTSAPEASKHKGNGRNCSLLRLLVLLICSSWFYCLSELVLLHQFYSNSFSFLCTTDSLESLSHPRTTDSFIRLILSLWLRWMSEADDGQACVGEDVCDILCSWLGCEWYTE